MKFFCSTCNKSFSAVPADGSRDAECPDCAAVVHSPENIGPGFVIGDFVIEKSITKGGMGEVFLAKQISLDRPVALKVLLPEFTNDRDYVASLFREARAAARISHPNIVQAYAVGSDEGCYYFAMELVRGDTLKNILRKEGILSAEKSAKIIRDIASALDVAWREQKLVHQDIKPDNIMIDINGFSKLADLGLAKTATMEDTVDEQSDEVLGTPQYISPEQLTGVSTDVRSDIYSLGATFYHIVTGKLPYRANDMEELARMHDAGNLTPPQAVKSDVPDELNRIIIKMMARNIEKRYQSPAELISDLDSFLNSSPNDGFVGKKIVAPRLSIPGKITVPAAEKSNNKKDGSDGEITLTALGSQSTAPSISESGKPVVIKPLVTASKGGKMPKAVSPVPAVAKPVVPKAVSPVPAVAKPVVPKAVSPAPAAAKPVVPKPVIPSGTAPEKSNVAEVTPSVAPSPFSQITPPGAAASSKNKKKDSNSRKIVKIVLLSIAGIILLAAVAAAAVFVLEKQGIISTQILTPVVDRVLHKAKNFAEKQNEPVKNITTDEVPETVIPTVSETMEDTLLQLKPTGRTRYINTLVQLREWRQINQTADQEMLQKVDDLWREFGNPLNKAEADEWYNIIQMFASLDESIRCAPARTELQRIHEQQIAEITRQLEEQERVAAMAEQERKAREAEFAAANQVANAERAQELKRSREKINEIRRDAGKLLTDCVFAMREAAISGDESKLNVVLREFNGYLNTTPTFSAAEKNEITRFKSFAAQIPAEYKKLKDLFKKISDGINSKNIRIPIGGGMYKITEVQPGFFTYRKGSRSEILKYEDLDAAAKKIIFTRLKVANVEFYSDMLHRKMPADSSVPSGFWKNVWPMVKKHF